MTSSGLFCSISKNDDIQIKNEPTWKLLIFCTSLIVSWNCSATPINNAFSSFSNKPFPSPSPTDFI
jgi:hypothetical protein